MSESNQRIKKINCLLSETNGLYHRVNVRLGLSDSIANILYQICDHDGVYGISDICLDLGIPKQTVNSALRQLEYDGLLYLESCGKRSKQAVLTERGKEYCSHTIATIFDMERAVLSTFTQDECAQFVHLQKKYNNALKSYIDGLAE